jgi:hypothetical protein
MKTQNALSPALPRQRPSKPMSGRCLKALLLLSCTMSGCGLLGTSEDQLPDPTKAVAPDFCAIAKPIYVTKTDVFADATAQQILQHNKTGQKLCGWKSFK